ncbi:MAG: DUF434 domain-containing protein [Bacteroidota bacterium]|nr:DUF434 domain-containing protein [Bacteroidota bacterium]
MTEIFTSNFYEAVKDYSFLLGKKYTPKSILKLVSDHYSLNTLQRTVLYRGIVAGFKARVIKSTLVESIREANIYIDTYNVLFIIANYLFGRIVFISNDGFLRDAGQATGKIQSEEVFYKAIDLLFEYLEVQSLQSVMFYVDSPIPYSGLLAAQLNQEIIDHALTGSAVTTHSPDYALKNQTDGILCTSDSVIIDKGQCRTFDLALHVLNEKYHPDFIDFGNLPLDDPDHKVDF